MAKKIIILNKIEYPSYFEVNYLFWLSVPTAQQPFRASSIATSLYSGSTTGEITALQNGSVLEKGGVASYLLGATNAEIGADLVSKFNAEQNALNSDDKYKYFGTFFDGTSWTIQGA